MAQESLAAHHRVIASTSYPCLMCTTEGPVDIVSVYVERASTQIGEIVWKPQYRRIMIRRESVSRNGDV